MLETPTASEIKTFLPLLEQIIRSSHEHLLPITLNELLGRSVEGSIMKWENILVHSKLINPNSNDHYEFAFRKRDGIVVKPNLGIDHHYKDAQECKYDSILHYAATYDRPLLSKTVFRIIDSKCASKQKSSRFNMTDAEPKSRSRTTASSGYYVLHYTRRGHANETRIIAIAAPISRDSVVFACFNHKYHTNDKDCYLLHCEIIIK